MYMGRMDLQACILLWIICFNVSKGLTLNPTEIMFNTTATTDTRNVTTPSPTPLAASTAANVETSTQTTNKATSCPSTWTVTPTLQSAVTSALSGPSSTTIGHSSSSFINVIKGNEDGKPNTMTEPLHSKPNTTTEPLQNTLNTTASSFTSSPGPVTSSGTEPSISFGSTGSSTFELVTTSTLPLTTYARGNARTDRSGLTSLSTQTENKTSSLLASAFPAEQPQNNLTMLAFGVMSLILILIVVMVILVTVVNLRGKCHQSKEAEGKKSGDSGVSESNSANLEKESITLVSMKSLNIETGNGSVPGRLAKDLLHSSYNYRE
ncbi:endothelial cell-specific chemotaxis regulator-like [Polyodon spathula]|uniref:endothelial cell-specific chemotaxis regulator-like n=1 Tax=Polyodon spathula TaxID=7913 RepID=UPI001B7E1804|nr:endothelial cell-specific chemotaxis regulator-like [Polyodon spathula]